MQCIYALIHSKDDSLEKQKVFLVDSIENMYALYLLMLSLFVELQEHASSQIKLSSNKYLTDASDDFPNREKFVQNKLLVQLAKNEILKKDLEKRKLKDWYLNAEYVKLIYKEVLASKVYKTYMQTPTSTFEEDAALVRQLFEEIIAPNDKIYDHFEDNKLTWVDDIPIVNTFLLKQLKRVKADASAAYFSPKLLKDKEDMQYAAELLSLTLSHNLELEKEIEGKTPNWDKDRIADIDAILLKMSICELLHFPTIPEKVTINEYLEIAKEYSTPKSSIFINGILDKLVKEYRVAGKMKKTGRGLL